MRVIYDDEPTLIEQLIEEKRRKGLLPKTSYTKDEVIAMLTEIQSKITEKSYYDTTIIGNYEDEVRIGLVELDDVNDIIQQKINVLKTESEEVGEDYNGLC